MSVVQVVNRWLPRSSFVRGVIVLGGGATAGQLILMAAAPLLTRLYSAEEFGIVAVFASMLSILSVVSSLRYELAIPIAKDDEEAAHGVILALLVALAMSLLTLLGVIGFREQIAAAFKIPAIAGYLWLLPLGLLLLSIYQVFYYWAIRIKRFSAIARTKLMQSVSSVVVQVGGASLGAVALLLGQVTGQAAGMSSLGILALRDRWHLFREVRLRQVLWVAQRYRQFPYFSTWGGLLNTIGMQLPPLLFAVLFSPAAAGIYALAHRVLSLPMSLVGQAIGNVFLSRAAEARREGNLALLVAKVHEKLAQIAMPLSLLLILVSPDLFSLVFGASWRQAGVFAQWMIPWLYLVFITSPLSNLFSVLEKQAQGMMLQAILVVARVTALFIGAQFNDLVFAVVLFSLGSTICWLGFLIWIIRASGNSWLVIWQPTIQSFVWGLLLISPLIATTLLPTALYLWVSALIISLLLIMTRYLVILKTAW